MPSLANSLSLSSHPTLWGTLPRQAINLDTPEAPKGECFGNNPLFTMIVLLHWSVKFIVDFVKEFLAIINGDVFHLAGVGEFTDKTSNPIGA